MTFKWSYSPKVMFLSEYINQLIVKQFVIDKKTPNYLPENSILPIQF
jgi:hypothetical protein